MIWGGGSGRGAAQGAGGHCPSFSSLSRFSLTSLQDSAEEEQRMRGSGDALRGGNRVAVYLCYASL